jgi:hypothetical protein
MGRSPLAVPRCAALSRQDDAGAAKDAAQIFYFRPNPFGIAERLGVET